jgi:CRISPR-associated protein Cas2
MQRNRFLVAYDIRDDVRLRKVHKTMKGFGYPLQYSVFLCDLDPSEKLQMLARLGDIINARADSVAIVDLGEPASRGQECVEFMGTNRGLPEIGPRIF